MSRVKSVLEYFNMLLCFHDTISCTFFVFLSHGKPDSFMLYSTKIKYKYPSTPQWIRVKEDFMTPKERILAALKGQPTDTLPFIPRLDIWYNANSRNGTLPAPYQHATLREMVDDLGLG